MEIENIDFKSDLFDIEPVEDEETNPRMYGRQLANWLRERFKEKGYDVEEVIPEDWGWCVMCTREPYWLWVGCSSLTDYDMANPGDPPPNKNEVTWSCFATAEVTLLKRILKSIDTKPGLQKLQSELLDIIQNEKRINIVDE